MKVAFLLILTILPLFIPGHIRNIFGWPTSFISFSIVNCLLGFSYKISSTHIPQYKLLFIFFSLLFPVYVFFSSREFWFPVIMPVFLLIGLISFIAGYFFRLRRYRQLSALTVVLLITIQQSIANINFIIYRAKLNPPEYEKLIGLNPSLNIYDLNNNLIDKSYLNGKMVFVDFGFMECEECYDKLITYGSLANYYVSKKNIVFLSVINGEIDSLNKLQKFAKNKHFNFLFTYDKNGEFERKYNIGITGYPVELRFNESGKISQIVVGFVDRNVYLTNSINSIETQFKK